MFKFIFLFFICLSPLALAENVKLESLTVLELKANEGKAVVQYHDGEEYVLKVGDAIPWVYAIIVQILPDKLVVEEVVEKEEYVTKQTVMIHAPESVGGHSKFERIEHNGYTRKALQLPKSDEYSQFSQ